MFTLTQMKNPKIKKSEPESKFDGTLAVIGMIVTMLVLITSAAGEVNATDMTTLNGSFVDNQTPVASEVPTPQPLNIVTILTTQAESVIAALTAQPTVVPVVSEKPDVAIAISTEDVIDLNTPIPNAGVVPLISAGTATNEQFTLRAGKRVTDAQLRAAAADYKERREAFLLQASEGYQTQGYSTAAAPLLDPGGIPHYFGPIPNWANSPMPMGSISNISVDSGGNGYIAPVVSIEDVYFTGSGATATAVVTGGVITGITVTNPGINYTAPVVIIGDSTGSDAAATASIGGPFNSGIRKFVDSLPGLNAAGVNDLGQYIPVAKNDSLSFPGDDYYEIALVQFTEKMHSDLPPTTLRGYVQLETPNTAGSAHIPLLYPNGTAILNSSGSQVFAYDNPHYLGPIIVAQSDKPVRVKFTNYLPVGSEGNLFIPVDFTVMGAGMGPLGMNTTPIYYTENRAAVHLHGGATPWISDGTPHQWTTPAGEYTSYPEGVSVSNVPDMPDPGDGSMTFFYSNQQSARLMFYHDHAQGITRLNVYVGEAAGYLVTDQAEKDMIDGTNVVGFNPTLREGSPRHWYPAHHTGQNLCGCQHHRGTGSHMELGDESRCAEHR